MALDLLTQFRGWLSSILVPSFRPYWEAKKLHEGSPHGLFMRGMGLYRELTPAEIDAAVRCPRLSRAVELYEQCIARESREGRSLNHGLALHQLGQVWHRQGKLDAAQKTYHDALNILE